MYSQPCRAKRPRLQPTLFDTLPLDICSRIAAYLSCGNPTQDALHLAETSPHLRNAVITTLAYKYVSVNSWYYSQDVVKRWAVLFGSELRDLTILQPRCSDQDAYELMLNSASLETARLQDTTYAMHHHLISKQITNLTIMLTDVLPHLLFSSLPSPRVRDLTLSCAHSIKGDSDDMTCAIETLCDWDGAQFITDAFPNLEAIELRCQCNCDKNLLWELLALLPNLQHIRLDDAHIPDKMLHRVSKLRSVKLGNLKYNFEVAAMVGTPLRSLQATSEPLEAIYFNETAAWSGLESINIAVDRGSEEAFLSVIPLFSESLHTLRLSRSSCDYMDVVVREEEGLPLEPKRGTWLEMVKKLPHIQHLGLTWIKINLDEVVAIIKQMGERLKTLDITLEIQSEHYLIRLEQVLLTAAIHCPSLRKLNVDVGEYSGPGLTTELFFPRKLVWMADMGKKLGRALESLKRRSPLFDAESLGLFIRRLVNL